MAASFSHEAGDRGYNLGEAARVTGHTRAQIEHLDRAGLMSPSIRRPGGTRRHFSFFDLVELRTLATMRAFTGENMSRQRVRRALDALHGVRTRSLVGLTLVSDCGSAFWIEEEPDLVEIFSRFHAVLAVSLHGVEYEVRRELAALAVDARAADPVGLQVDADGPPPALPPSSVASLTGLSARQLRYLAKTGLIVPSVRRPARGVAAGYAPSDLLALLVVERVRAVCGQQILVSRLRRPLDALTRRIPRAGQYLVIDAETCWIEGASPEATLRRTGAALVVDLDALAAELAERLRRAGISVGGTRSLLEAA